MQPRVLATTIGLVSLVVAVATAGPAAASTVGASSIGSSAATGTPAGCDSSAGLSLAATTVSCNAVQLDNTSTWHGHHIGRLVSQITPAGYGPAELQQAYT